MKRLCSIFVAATGLMSVASAQEVDFARDIQPILNAKCVECHGGVKSAGGFSFVYQDRVVNFEADSGERVVVAGKPEQSEMIQRIQATDESVIMPPPEAHGPLSAREKELITRWIQQGAKWRGHWAFEPPQRPPVPKPVFAGVAASNIDRFIFRRLQQEGLKPAAVEAPGRLLRRLSIGLVGLPPTVAELDAFESAYSKDPAAAIETAVDKLMARPAFGERWATMWLDLVRYADSGGLGLDQRRTIWAYRDWVVKAFNDDMPFDQFTIKQLAGDLLPQPTTLDLVATACHRNTQTNNEGGTDDEEFRVEAVIDRVNTTWQTWGSVTFGCVQCHDHPYDPFRNDEYYKFMGFFNNSADSDLPDDAPRLKVPNDPQNYVKAQQLRQQVLELKQQIWTNGIQLRDDTTWRSAHGIRVTAQNDTPYSVEKKAAHTEFYTSGTVSTKTRTQIGLAADNFNNQPVTALRLTVLPLNPKTSIHSPEWGFTVTDLKAWIVKQDNSKTEIKFRISVPDVPWLPSAPLRRIDPNGKNWGAQSRIHHARQIILVPETALTVALKSRLDVHISCDRVSGGSHPLVIKRGHVASTSDPRWNDFGKTGTEAQRWMSQLAREEKQLQGIPGTSIPIMLGRPEVVARPTHVFLGGNSMSKDQRVTAGLPTSLTRVASVPTNSAALSRLEMAQWWVSERNPLTARVFANRVWEQLFGTGIVLTLEDFGSSGEKPTHPELLDYLAVRFQKDHHWSMKRIIREIVLSHAYQQSSRISTELLERDPGNRLIARGPRLRLSAEFVRDHALACSGLLTTKVGGPPVHPPLPQGVWQPFDGGDKWNTAKPNDANRYRRSIYTYMKRSIPFPSFATFDAPSREFCTPRRLTSNTPLQALVLLNDQAFVECAESFGQRMQAEFKGTPQERLGMAYRIVTGRRAGQNRLEQLVRLYETLKTNGAADKQRTDNRWTVIAQVLLNLDESLTY